MTTKVYIQKKTTWEKDKFSEIQLCGKRGVNREKGVSRRRVPVFLMPLYKIKCIQQYIAVINLFIQVSHYACHKISKSYHTINSINIQPRLNKQDAIK